MANIINVSRTYRMTSSIPLDNDQLDSELSNIVDRVNKNISYVTSNIYLNSTIIETSAIGVTTGVWADLTSLTIPNGEWDIWASSVLVVQSIADGAASDPSFQSGLGYVSGDNYPNADPLGSASAAVRVPFYNTLNTKTYYYLHTLPFRFNSTPASTALYNKVRVFYNSTHFGTVGVFGMITARKVNT